MTLLNRIEDVQKLWAVVLPHLPSPEGSLVGQWCEEFEDSLIEKGIVRLSKKFRAGAPEPLPTHVSGYMLVVMSGLFRAKENLRLQTEREKAERREAERLKKQGKQ